MWGTLASVSTLLTSVGLGSSVRAVRAMRTRLPPFLRGGREQPVLVGREPARQRRLALDDLEHRLLLAEQVLVGAGDDGDGAVGADAGGLDLLHGAGDAGDLALEAGLEADERLLGADGEGGDDQALDHLVRVGPQQRRGP